MFAGLQTNNVADNINQACNGAGDGHCSLNNIFGELITGRITLESPPIRNPASAEFSVSGNAAFWPNFPVPN